MKFIKSILKYFMKIKITRISDITLVVVIFLIMFPITIALKDIIKIPFIIITIVNVILGIALTSFLCEKMYSLKELVDTIIPIRYLGGFLIFLLIFYGFIISIFGITYNMIDVFANNASDLNLKWFYFSTITLTTVGYGDITPSCGIMQYIAAIEGLIGYISPSVIISVAFVFIFKANKL